MRTHFKTLVFAIATLVAFLACSNNLDSSDYQGNQIQGPKCKQVAPISLAIPEDVPDGCISEGKKAFRISEMHWEEIDWNALGGGQSGSMTSAPVYYDSITGEISVGKTYTLNGEEMSEEEYGIRIAEYQAKYNELIKGKRPLDLHTQCIIGDDAMGWTALLTDEEADALRDEYGELLIERVRDIEIISTGEDGEILSKSGNDDVEDEYGEPTIEGIGEIEGGGCS